MTAPADSNKRFQASLWLTLSLTLGLAILMSSLARTSAVQATGPCARYVLGIDTSDSSDCSDMAHPCRTVQFAIDQAAPGRECASIPAT